MKILVGRRGNRLYFGGGREGVIANTRKEFFHSANTPEH